MADVLYVAVGEVGKTHLVKCVNLMAYDASANWEDTGGTAGQWGQASGSYGPSDVGSGLGIDVDGSGNVAVLVSNGDGRILYWDGASWNVTAALKPGGLFFGLAHVAFDSSGLWHVAGHDTSVPRIVEFYCTVLPTTFATRNISSAVTSVNSGTYVEAFLINNADEAVCVWWDRGAADDNSGRWRWSWWNGVAWSAQASLQDAYDANAAWNFHQMCASVRRGSGDFRLVWQRGHRGGYPDEDFYSYEAVLVVSTGAMTAPSQIGITYGADMLSGLKTAVGSPFVWADPTAGKTWLNGGVSTPELFGSGGRTWENGVEMALTPRKVIELGSVGDITSENNLLDEPYPLPTDREFVVSITLDGLDAAGGTVAIRIYIDALKVLDNDVVYDAGQSTILHQTVRVTPPSGGARPEVQVSAESNNANDTAIDAIVEIYEVS